METKVFSVEDGSMVIDKENNYIGLYNGQMRCIASNLPEVENYAFGRKLYQLPQSILHPTDEELAEAYADGKSSSSVFKEAHIADFLTGRKSFGDKKYHLSEDELKELINTVRIESIKSIVSVTTHKDNSFFIESITSQPIYPHTITAYFDGENYIWETLKADY